MVSCFASSYVAAFGITQILGCTTTTNGRPAHDGTSTMSSNASQSTAQVVIGNAITIPWSRLPGALPVDVGPTDGGQYEVPGPATIPVRPQLEVTAGPGGIAAVVVQGDGKLAALAILNGGVIALPSAPQSVVARTDGVWALYRDRVVHYDRDGKVVLSLGLAGVALTAASENSVWLTSLDRAWHIGGAGAIHGPYAWKDPLVSFARGDLVCRADRRNGQALACLSLDGTESTLELPLALAPLEQPLAFDTDRLVTVDGTTVRVHRRSELVGEWTLQVAGLDAAHAGFVVTATAGAPALVRAGSPRTVRTFAAGSPRVVSAAAVNGDTVTLYGRGLSVTHLASSNAAAPSTLSTAIDEAAYRATIFPSCWEMSPTRGIAARPDGGIVVAASGPEGVALIELRAAREPAGR